MIVQLMKKPPAMQEILVPFLGWEDLLEKKKSYPLQYSGLENSMDCIVHGVTKSWTQLNDFHFHFHQWASLIAQLVKNLPAMQETWVRFLGWKDPLEKGMATIIIHEIAKSRTWLSRLSLHLKFQIPILINSLDLPLEIYLTNTLIYLFNTSTHMCAC